MKYNIVPPHLYNFEAFFIVTDALEDKSVICLYFDYMSSLNCSCSVSTKPSGGIEAEIKNKSNSFKLICFRNWDFYNQFLYDSYDEYFSKIITSVKSIPQSEILNTVFHYDYRNFESSNKQSLLISVDNKILPTNRPKKTAELNCQEAYSGCLDQTQERTPIHLKMIFEKEIGFFTKKKVIISEYYISLYLFHNFEDIGIDCSASHNDYNLSEIKESFF